MERFPEIRQKAKRITASVVAGSAMFLVGTPALASEQNQKVEASITTSSAESLEDSADFKKSPFVDIYGTHFPSSYRIAIESLWEKGIVNGYVDNGQIEFRPEAPITRGQFAKILAKSMDLSVPEKAVFPDDFIEAVKEAGLMRGKTSGEFGEDENITNKQFITVMVRALDKLGKLSDYVPVSFESSLRKFDNPNVTYPDFDNAPLLAHYNGLLDGINVEALDIDRPTSRSEGAQMISNLIRIKENENFPPEIN